MTVETLLPALVADLARAQSGIEFIYRALDRVVEWSDLENAFIVVDDAVVGRQVFRSGRRSWRDLDRDVLNLGTGLYTEPEMAGGPVGEAVAQLCVIALQLDLSRHDATHDPLTGLYNRRSFDVMLQQSAVRSSRYGWRFTFALVDLDRFKTLNDQFGHEAGDRILRTVGVELRSSLRGGDAAARIGGDEFALLLHNGDRDTLGLLLGRLQAAVGELVGMDVGFSAGVATAPDDSSDPGELYRLADQHLYDNKRKR